MKKLLYLLILLPILVGCDAQDIQTNNNMSITPASIEEKVSSDKFDNAKFENPSEAKDYTFYVFGRIEENSQTYYYGIDQNQGYLIKSPDHIPTGVIELYGYFNGIITTVTDGVTERYQQFIVVDMEDIYPDISEEDIQNVYKYYDDFYNSFMNMYHQMEAENPGSNIHYSYADDNEYDYESDRLPVVYETAEEEELEYSDFLITLEDGLQYDMISLIESDVFGGIYFYYDPAVDDSECGVIKTDRHITLGSLKSTVLSAYGRGEDIEINDPLKTNVCTMMERFGREPEFIYSFNIDSYVSYSYYDYKLEFYFSNDKVVLINFFKN